MPMKLERGDKYSVQILGGKDGAERSSIVYEGTSLQFAHHDVNTTKTAAILSGGTLLIILRKGGEVVSRFNICNGQVMGVELAVPAGGTK